MALIIDGNMPKNCFECKFAEMRYASDRECRCGLLGYGICMEITRGAELERHISCPIIGEVPDELENLIIAMSQFPREKPKTATEAKEALAYEELERRMKKEMQNGFDN